MIGIGKLQQVVYRLLPIIVPSLPLTPHLFESVRDVCVPLGLFVGENLFLAEQGRALLVGFQHRVNRLGVIRSHLCQHSTIRPKITKMLVLPLPTDSTKCPYSTHFICQFQIKILFLFCTKKEQILSYCITFTYTFC
jgi:hypothetical protein